MQPENQNVFHFMLHVAPGCTRISMWWRMQEQPPHVTIYMIMHHTYFWEEIIDKGGRLCGRAVNISHRTSDLVGQSGLSLYVYMCVSVYASTSLCVHVQSNNAWAVVLERLRVCGTCVGVCVCVGEQHSYPSKSPVGRPLPREKNEACPMRSACPCCSSAAISSWFTLSGEQTHLTSHRHATFTTLPQEADTYSKDACVYLACWRSLSQKECPLSWIKKKINLLNLWRQRQKSNFSATFVMYDFGIMSFKVLVAHLFDESRDWWNRRRYKLPSGHEIAGQQDGRAEGP